MIKNVLNDETSMDDIIDEVEEIAKEPETAAKPVEIPTNEGNDTGEDGEQDALVSAILKKLDTRFDTLDKKLTSY